MHKKRILIVEDESLIAEDIAHRLRSLGYDVPPPEAYGENVVDAVQASSPDLIIMDVKLKGEMDGISAAEAVQQITSCPVIYLTAFADDDLLQRARITQPFGYILKPYNDRELHAAIQMALHKHELETELKETKEWLQATMRSIGDAVIVTDRQGKVKFLNKIAEALTEWRAEDALGKSLIEVFSLVDVEKSGPLEILSPDVLQDFDVENELIEAASLRTHLANIKHVSGTILNKRNLKLKVEDSFAPIHKDGEDLGHVLVFRDISEKMLLKKQKEELEENLIQSRKMESLGTMASGIAHDFNNLLSVILGFTEIVQQAVPADSDIQEDLAEIEQAGIKARDLVNQILSFVRQKKYQLIALSPGPILRQTVSFLRCFAAKHIAVQTRISPRNVLIKADPSQLNQIFLNICVNACQALESQELGTLEISLEEVQLTSQDLAAHPEMQPGPFVKICISDNGVGIDPTISHRIFDPYFTTKEEGKGTGMGLSTSLGIVRSFGGMIRVTSEPGKGTSFFLYFPVVEIKVTKEKSMTYEEQLRVSILLVDDDKQYGKMFKRILESLGHTVSFQPSSADALQLFENDPSAFDLVVTDQIMPEMVGTEMARKMFEVRPDIPVILCTGFSAALEGVTDPEHYGVRAIAMKPISHEKIHALIHEVCNT